MLVSLPEWLMGRPAKPVGTARVGSNPAADVFILTNKNKFLLLFVIEYFKLKL